MADTSRGPWAPRSKPVIEAKATVGRDSGPGPREIIVPPDDHVGPTEVVVVKSGDTELKAVKRAYPRYKKGSKEVLPEELFRGEYTEDDIKKKLRRDEIANKLVRKLSRDTVGKWFTIDAKKPVKKAIEETLQDLDAKHYFYRAMVHMWGRGRCALMLGTENDTSIEKERDGKSKIIYLHAMHPDFIPKPGIHICDDPAEDRYGDVDHIMIKRLEKEADVEKKVPRSRFIWMANIVTVDDPLGESILMPIMDQLTTKKSLDWSVGETYFKNASPLHQLELPFDADEEEFDNAQKDFKDISARTEFVTPEGYKIYLHGTQNAMSPKPYTEHNLKCISAGLDVPYQLLLGTAAGAVTGAEMNLKDYYQSIAVMQSLIIEPFIRELITALQTTGQIPEGDYTISWSPLEEMDEKERAEIAKMGADALVSATNALPKLLKYGLACRFVDGRLVVEDGEVKKPEEEPMEEPTVPPGPQPGEPSAPFQPIPPEGPQGPSSLPPDKSGPRSPSGSPYEQEQNLIDEYVAYADELGVPMSGYSAAVKRDLFHTHLMINQRRLSKAERQELTDKYYPETDLFVRQATSDLITGLNLAVEDLVKWLKKEVTKGLKKVQKDVAVNSPLDEENPVLWRQVYESEDLAMKVEARKITNPNAKKVSGSLLDSSFETGYVKALTAIEQPVAGVKPLRFEPAIKWLKVRKKRAYMRFTDATGAGQMKQVLMDCFDRGWGMPKLQAELGKVIRQSEVRLEAIARTEAARAASEGSIQSYRDNGVKDLEFLTTPDDITCDECMTKDGRRYPIDESSGVIPVHDRCRCCLLPVTETMELGPGAEIPPTQMPLGV